MCGSSMCHIVIHMCIDNNNKTNYNDNAFDRRDILSYKANILTQTYTLPLSINSRISWTYLL